MLFPENPEKRPILWDALAKQLVQTEVCFVIERGSGDPFVDARLPNDDVAREAMGRLRRSQICRISADRGIAVSPHFSGIINGNSIFVTEMICVPEVGESTIRLDRLRHDIEVVVLNLLFARGGANRVTVPLHLDPWSMKDADVVSTDQGLVFEKKI
ncbi:hypothetical protein U0E23_18930 [Burkholderia stagnalis]|uniref:hypothetical protein n=1 Tax=Burkholderia stagnalis TaxID=1503054 RepID=UPI002AB4ACA3|nr:hypothetical protein [Burkholderia stagnalis]MDY7804520.1 hypothetical protein [Burkholderia stagnalis]